MSKLINFSFEKMYSVTDPKLWIPGEPVARERCTVNSLLLKIEFCEIFIIGGSENIKWITEEEGGEDTNKWSQPTNERVK